MNAQKQKIDLALWEGTVLTMDINDTIIGNGSIAINEGKILEVGPSANLRKNYSAKNNIDMKGKIIMPGIINTHTHLAMSVFRGCADDVPLEDWLGKFIFPLEDKFINDDSAHWGSLLSCAEMLLSGTTTFCDMYFFEKETGFAAEKIGMRAVIGEGIVAMDKDAEKSWKKKKDLTLELIDAFKNSKLVSVAVEPHSPYACEKKILIETKEFARKNNLLFAIHLAETKKEYMDFMETKKMTPTAYLDSLGILDEKTISAHSVWMGKDDFAILKMRGVKISHCPQSNMKLGSGIAPIARFMKNGITVSLGTDGAASNNTLDMFREMKCAAILAKVSGLNPSAISAREVLRMATIEGAKTLGKENEIGSLEAGKNADIISIDLYRPHLTPVYDLHSHIVYSASGSDVNDAIVNGIVVMHDRKLKNINIGRVMKKVICISDEIKKDLGS
jgi:5-methylthioadenosine/S-adenosylhomocysteine deaminase